MSHKLVMILSALGVSVVTLPGCVDDSGYRYYETRAPALYREQVVIERRDYYVGRTTAYYRRDRPQYLYTQSADRRSPRCFGTNCYVGATYREDPYYRLSN